MVVAGKRSARRHDAGSCLVVFIGGCQRSGSTLLDRMLSQVEGHVSAGEIVHLWSRGLQSDELCGCGEPFSRCPFWSEVGRAAFGGWDQIDPQKVLDLQRKVDRNRYIFFMLLPHLSRHYAEYRREYSQLLNSLYRSVALVGGGIVVDSSKHASTAFLLRGVPSIRLKVVHLVRDSRGVAYSLTRRIRRPEARSSDSLMHRSGPWRSSLEWSVFNLLFHFLHLTGTPVKRVRYEDLVADPRPQLASIVGPAEGQGEGDRGEHDTLAFVDGRRVALGLDHTVAGNPMRFERGVIPLRSDDEWQTRMPAFDRFVTTMMTWPLLAAYRYPLARRS